MTTQKSALALALFLVTTAALALEPTSPSSAPPLQAPAAPLGVQVPAAATAAPAPTAAKSTAAPVGPAVKATSDPAATAKAAHELGYAPRQRSGKTVYCKAEAPIGSRLSSTKCYSEEEMTAVVQRSIQNKDSVAQMQRTELYQDGKQ